MTDVLIILIFFLALEAEPSWEMVNFFYIDYLVG